MGNHGAETPRSVGSRKGAVRGEQTPRQTRTLGRRQGAQWTKRPMMYPGMGQVTEPPLTARRERKGAASTEKDGLGGGEANGGG